MEVVEESRRKVLENYILRSKEHMKYCRNINT